MAVDLGLAFLQCGLPLLEPACSLFLLSSLPFEPFDFLLTFGLFLEAPLPIRTFGPFALFIPGGSLAL